MTAWLRKHNLVSYIFCLFASFWIFKGNFRWLAERVIKYQRQSFCSSGVTIRFFCKIFVFLINSNLWVDYKDEVFSLSRDEIPVTYRFDSLRSFFFMKKIQISGIQMWSESWARTDMRGSGRWMHRLNFKFLINCAQSGQRDWRAAAGNDGGTKERNC